MHSPPRTARTSLPTPKGSPLHLLANVASEASRRSESPSPMTTRRSPSASASASVYSEGSSSPSSMSVSVDETDTPTPTHSISGADVPMQTHPHAGSHSRNPSESASTTDSVAVSATSANATYVITSPTTNVPASVVDLITSPTQHKRIPLTRLNSQAPSASGAPLPGPTTSLTPLNSSSTPTPFVPYIRPRKRTRKPDLSLKHRIAMKARRKELMEKATKIKSLDNSPVNERQLLVLRMVYDEITMYPCESWMVLVAIIIHRAYKQIKNWFSNERQKNRTGESLPCETTDGDKVRLRASALAVCAEWSDTFFEEVVMIYNFKIQRNCGIAGAGGTAAAAGGAGGGGGGRRLLANRER